MPGAKTYFVGSYSDNGDGTWSGYEQWVLFANERWQETGEDDERDCELAKNSHVCANRSAARARQQDSEMFDFKADPSMDTGSRD